MIKSGNLFLYGGKINFSWSRRHFYHKGVRLNFCTLHIVIVVGRLQHGGEVETSAMGTAKSTVLSYCCSVFKIQEGWSPSWSCRGIQSSTRLCTRGKDFLLILFGIPTKYDTRWSAGLADKYDYIVIMAGSPKLQAKAHIKRVYLDIERIKFWLATGATPSDTGMFVVLSLLNFWGNQERSIWDGDGSHPQIYILSIIF